MRNRIHGFVLFMVITGIFFNPVIAQPQIIFDTDFGGDADDLGALVMLYNMMDRGELDLLAVMSWSTERYTIPAIDAVSRFYGYGDIPLGVRKDGTHYQAWNYNEPIAQAMEYERTYDSVPDAIDLYRKILAASEDNSVIIVTVGPLMNIKNLIQSGPDHYSYLTGNELIEKKVEKFVIMGGRFPEGEWEWNFSGNMPGVTRFVLDNLTVPITFSGFEVGLPIRTGTRLNELDPSHPLYIGYMHFSEHASWMADRFEGEILDNASYDQTAVLYAVRGEISTLWEYVENGYCQPDDDGGNKWISGNEHPEKDHRYLRLLTEPGEVAEIIESIMLNEF